MVDKEESLDPSSDKNHENDILIPRNLLETPDKVELLKCVDFKMSLNFMKL